VHSAQSVCSQLLSGCSGSSTILVGEAIRLAGIGVAIGVVGAVGLTRSVSGMLFGVRPTDPLAAARRAAA
jgi:hypothetical protein